MENRLSFGQALSGLRESAGLTIEQLSVKTELPASLIAEYENQPGPQVDRFSIDKIAKALDVPMGLLFWFAWVENRYNTEESRDSVKGFYEEVLVFFEKLLKQKRVQQRFRRKRRRRRFRIRL
jgi:transcriptional regulator with XRE-family HTH domain